LKELSAAHGIDPALRLGGEFLFQQFVERGALGELVKASPITRSTFASKSLANFLNAERPSYRRLLRRRLKWVVVVP
jgi:hypothetical protein